MDAKSRLDKFEKRRKNKRRITALVVLAGVLIVVLAGFWLFGGSSNQAANTKSSNEHIKITESDSNNSESDSNNTDDTSKEDPESDNADEEDSDGLNKKEVESSDSNVVEAFTADWQPVGTEQTGPHTTNYDDGSQDRKEIKHAAAMATGLDENNMTTYWVGNAGDQKVTTTVFNGNQSEIYRVSLTWHDGQGWQVNKVEKLKEPAH